jgi:A118 family predicted phage portal protein
MEEKIYLWKQMEGTDGLKPPWCDENIRAIRFSNTVARELAKLITQNIDIKAESAYGGAEKGEKAADVQSALDNYFLKNAQENIETMIRIGGVMAKWNGSGIEYLPPDRFLITEFDSTGEVTGCIFFSFYSQKDKFYTRAEWHRFEDATRDGEKVRNYHISNKAFVSDQKDEIGREISLKKTKWADIEPEANIEGLEKPLFTYLKCPYSNTIDADSPLGVSLFSECVEELRWLDVAMSTMGTETETSAPIMFVDNSTILTAQNMGIKLPKFIKGMQMGVGADNTIEQWQPKLQVDDRKEAINFYLSIISYKCGFDPGYFVFNGQTNSVATATQVEATERRTINTVNAFRNLLDRPDSNGDGRVGFVHDIAYIIDTMATMQPGAVLGDYGNYKLYCDFADLSVNPEEEEQTDYQLTQNKYMAKWKFLVLHRGMTEEDAKQCVAEAMEEDKAYSKSIGGLFGEE